MVRVNSHGYLEKIDPTQRGRRHTDSTGKTWWLVKYRGSIHLGNFRMPVRYIGKKVMFRVEIMEEPDPLKPRLGRDK